MLTLAYYLAVPVVAVALLVGHLRFWTWFYGRTRRPDERHFVKTSDGWTVALSRYHADPKGPGAGAPVICCPGLACNARLFDLDDDFSLAQHLAGQGFDVWVLDPRGTGHSERSGWGGQTWRYGFVEYVRQDAVAALEHVVGVTGGEVLWVGHSMGGLIGYHVATCCDAGAAIAGIAALGSPADFSGHRETMGLPTFVLDRFLRRWPVVRLGRLGRLISPFAGRVRSYPESLFLSSSNVHGATLRRFLVDVLEDVPRRLLDQFADNILRGTGFDGRPVSESLAPLSGYTGPLLTVAGDADMLASPASVRAAAAQLGSDDVTEVVMGQGTRHFGHLDLLIGDAAPGSVYPLVSDWLCSKSTLSTDSAEDSSDDSAACSPAGA